MKTLENGLQTHSGASLQSCRSVDADAWCKRALNFSVSNHLRIIWHMRVTAFYFDPASQVEWTAVADVDVLGGQEVNHVHDERRDPHQNHVLSDPPRVVVQRVLKFRKCLFTLRDCPKSQSDVAIYKPLFSRVVHDIIFCARLLRTPNGFHTHSLRYHCQLWTLMHTIKYIRRAYSHRASAFACTFQCGER